MGHCVSIPPSPGAGSGRYVVAHTWALSRLGRPDMTWALTLLLYEQSTQCWSGTRVVCSEAVASGPAFGWGCCALVQVSG